jgi:SAM-dependent methyltransferase
MTLRIPALLVSSLLLASCALQPPAPVAPPATPDSPRPEPTVQPPSATVKRLQAESRALQPLVSTKLANDFLAETRNLPNREPRTIYQDPRNSSQYYSKAESAKLPAEVIPTLRPVVMDEERYYFTKYGSPLAYVRALELAGENGIESLAGKRVLDFGYGTVAHLRLLAQKGAHAVGVDVDTYLRALYSEPDDEGPVRRRGVRDADLGSVTLVHGRYPADAAVAKEVGGRYSLILSKNTLKRGYIKPSRPAEERHLIRLGVSDEVFLKSVYDDLLPGGMLLIYNLAPAQAPANKPYLPWADARSPYTKKQFETAGFKVIALDVNDDSFAREMGRRLGWDKNAKGEVRADYEKDLFALYTLVVKP